VTAFSRIGGRILAEPETLEWMAGQGMRSTDDPSWWPGGSTPCLPGPSSIAPIECDDDRPVSRCRRGRFGFGHRRPAPPSRRPVGTRVLDAVRRNRQGIARGRAMDIVEMSPRSTMPRSPPTGQSHALEGDGGHPPGDWPAPAGQSVRTRATPVLKNGDSRQGSRRTALLYERRSRSWTMPLATTHAHRLQPPRLAGVFRA